MIITPKMICSTAEMTLASTESPNTPWNKTLRKIGIEQDEAGAEERSHDGAEAADDDHEQDAERQVDRERRRLDRLQIGEGEQRAADAAVERADREGLQLGAQQRQGPSTSAATSMSRTAIQPRPMLPRAMFLASSASTATIASTTQYFSRRASKP